MFADTAVVQQLISFCDSTSHNTERTVYESINITELTQIILIKKLQDKLVRKIQQRLAIF